VRGSYASTFRYVLFIPSSWYKIKGQFFFSKSYLFTKLHGVTSQYIVTIGLPSELEISHRSSDFLFGFSMIDVPLSCISRLTPSRIDAVFSGEAFLTIGRNDDPSRQGEMRVQG